MNSGALLLDAPQEAAEFHTRKNCGFQTIPSSLMASLHSDCQTRLLGQALEIRAAFLHEPSLDSDGGTTFGQPSLLTHKISSGFLREAGMS